MSEAFDLAGYLRRIGYAGPHEPTLAVLRKLHALHPAAIPFENLDPLLGRPVKLDVPVLQSKMLGQQRGGYCYEQNTLFATVLDTLGFETTRLAGRVRWNVQPGAPESPRTHMLLRVEIDGAPYVADVGFGGYILSGPLKLTAGLEQKDAGNLVRFAESDGHFTFQLHLGDAWRDIYRFTLEPQLPMDYAVGNWWTSTSPLALLTRNLLAERLTPEARYSLFNTKFTTRHADGRVEERRLSGPDELGKVLGETLAIRLPASPAEIWARLPKD
jgi:N-hydroxyarylamine O-acetyltransferase